MTRRTARWAGVVGAIVLIAAADAAGTVLPMPSLVADAEARVGRPATPGSYAGVARRTTRRTIRRSAIYVSALPRGCARTSINGAAIWSCGGTYYQPYGGRYVVVYVD